MATVVPEHDEALMPITLGHPLRCPSADWHKYGIRWDSKADFLYLVGRGRDCYRAEWKSGDPGQIDVVEKASEMAFEGVDSNQVMREATGKVVTSYLNMREPGKYLVVEIGAGAGQSFETFYKSLPSDFRGEIHVLLLDPSQASLEKAAETVKKLGVSYEVANDTQDNLPKYMKGRKADVIFQVGSIHHDPSIPFDMFSECTAHGGLFASGDWHPQAWQDPGYVFQMLQTLDWPKKEQGLENYKKAYGVKDTPLPEDPKDRKSITDIWKFWKCYFHGLVEWGDPGKNAIWPHEGHQDFRRYLKSMQDVGYSTNNPMLDTIKSETGVGNPHFHYPDSSVNVNVAGIKPRI